MGPALTPRVLWEMVTVTPGSAGTESEAQVTQLPISFLDQALQAGPFAFRSVLSRILALYSQESLSLVLT